MYQNINNQVFGQRREEAVPPMIIEIDTRNTLAGGSANNEYLYSINNSVLDSYIDLSIDWGDGTWSRITSRTEASIPHVYSVPGVYEIKIYAPYSFLINANFGTHFRQEAFPLERLKLLRVKQWGGFINSRGAFSNCSNCVFDNISGAPLTILGSGENLFVGCDSLVTIDNLSNTIFTATGSITTVFQSCPNFNQDFVFNAPNATGLLSTFRGCTSFNSQITFNAPNITTLTNTFRQCTAFNQDISAWFDWTKIVNMSEFMHNKSNYNPEYYDSLLIALDNAGNSNVPLGMGGNKYTSAGATARANLITKGWTINDGGLI